MDPRPLTESSLPASAQLDQLPTAQALRLFHEQDRLAVESVAAIAPAVAQMIDRVAIALRDGGRLIYAGAGTSGRLGVLDASECPPTFRSDPQQVVGLIAGGPGAMFVAVEGAEDDPIAGAALMDQHEVGEKDVVLGITTSGGAPFVRGVLERAGQRGAFTALLACVEKSEREPAADLVLRPLTGPEILTGSTRLKAGTATKLILNQITTLAMVKIGKTYGHLMVDLKASNTKLRDRAERIIMQLCQIDQPAAAALLVAAGDHVKTAVVMHHKQTNRETAERMLKDAGGHLRSVVAWASRP